MKKIRIRDFIRPNGIDGIKISGIDKNTQITYYEASQDQRRGFSKNLSLGIRKNPETSMKTQVAEIVATYECHRCLAPSNGEWRRDSPFGQKNLVKNVARFLQISPVDAEQRSTS